MWSHITGALTSPAPTLREVARERALRAGFIFILIVSGLRGLSAACTRPALGPLLEKMSSLPELQPLTGSLQDLASPVSVVSGALLGGLASWLFWGTVFYAAGRLLKGNGNLPGLLAALAFAEAPRLLQAPLSALCSLLGAPGSILAGILGFGFGVWVLALGVVAVREAHGFSTWAALLTVIVPFALIGFVLAALAALAAFLVALFASLS